MLTFTKITLCYSLFFGYWLCYFQFSDDQGKGSCQLIKFLQLLVAHHPSKSSCATGYIYTTMLKLSYRGNIGETRTRGFRTLESNTIWEMVDLLLSLLLITFSLIQRQLLKPLLLKVFQMCH